MNNKLILLIVYESIGIGSWKYSCFCLYVCKFTYTILYINTVVSRVLEQSGGCNFVDTIFPFCSQKSNTIAVTLSLCFYEFQPLNLFHPSTSRCLICWQSHIKPWKVCRTLELILVLLTHIPNFCVPSITSFYFTCSPGLCGRIPCLFSGTIGKSTSSFVWNTRIS